jgi:pyruvate/2-oxoglutarate dehydrogenase complex dihydrolipoamide dehydrogenase (E3) component
MRKKIDFDYIVIGGGIAGRTVACNLANAKEKVALVSRGKIGGTEINKIDLPFGVNLDFAHLYGRIQHGEKMGYSGLNFRFDFQKLINWQDKIIKKASDEALDKLNQAGVSCITGEAKLVDKNTVTVEGKEYRASRIILATGSTLKDTGIAGLDDVDYLTPQTAMRLERVPRAVAVVGGGAAGCEVAEYFAELGSKVLVLEMTGRILPHEDEEVGKTLGEFLAKERGMMVLPDCRVTKLEKDAISRRVIFVNNGRERMVRVDTIVLATGSMPVLDYGLENAGVSYKKTGIVVDKTFQTSTRNIFAIGDCIGGDSSTERAEYQANFLSSLLTSRNKNTLNYNGFARVVRTYPEVASVGYNEDDMIKRDHVFSKALVNLGDTMAGKATCFDKGFVKILADSNGRVIGGTVVAPNAESVISEIAMAVRYHATVAELATLPHPANNYSAAIKMAAREIALKKRWK